MDYRHKPQPGGPFCTPIRGPVPTPIDSGVEDALAEVLHLDRVAEFLARELAR